MGDPAGCRECRDLAAELALGLVTGRERAEAYAHLDACPDCRAHVESLTRVQDALRNLSPVHDPPLGFESRVLARLPRPPRRSRATVLIAAAAAVAVLFGSGWAAADLATSRPAAPPSASASDLRIGEVTAGGRDIGQAFAYPGPPAWLYMYLEVEPGSTTGPVTCTATRTDGTSAVVGTFHLSDGDAFWGGPVGAVPIAAVEVTDGTGAVIASAQLPG